MINKRKNPVLYIIKIMLLRQFATQIKEIGKELHIRVHKFNLIPANWKNNSISISLEKQNKVFFGVKTNKEKQGEFTTNEMLSGEYAALNLWQSSLLYDNINHDTQFWKDIESGKLKKFVKHFTEVILDLYNNNSSLSTQ